MIKAKMNAGTYRGESESFSPLAINRFVNKIYLGNRIVAISARDKWVHETKTWEIKLVMKEKDFPMNIYGEVNAVEFEAFLNSVEWEVGE